MLPKIISLLGFISFNFLNSQPKNRLALDLETLQENICIVGGILCLIAVDKKTTKKFLLNER